MPTSILKDLNPEQRLAVTTTEGPLLIIAGAGTGKTAVITRRIAYIIEKKLARPEEILALTFTEKASAEMEERVDILVPYGFINTWISTFHAFGDRVLKENALDIGLPSDFKVLSKPQQILFFQQNLFRFNIDYYRPLSNPTKFTTAILSFFSRLKDENISPQDLIKFAKTHKFEDDEIGKNQLTELADTFEKYEKYKDEAGLLDFGDLVTKTIYLFNKRPHILKKYQNQFKYILVDEYQDSNYAQNELVKMLARSHKNICVVGDDDQSIYKFRGAAISNILEFKNTYKNTKTVVLTKNYRSTQAILDSAYKLIKNNNPDRLEVQNKIDKKLISQTSQGLPPQEIYATTVSEEADAVAEEIERLTSSKGKNNYQFKDIAILVRAGFQADSFLRALNLKGIPYKFVGSSGLYQQKEVALLIAFLTAINDFEDSLNIYDLITSEIYDLNLEDAIKLNSFAKRKNRSFYYILKNYKNLKAEDLEVSDISQQIIENLLSDLEYAIKLSQTESAGKVLYEFLHRSNYLKNLEKEGGIENQLKIQNIAKFFDKIKEFELITNSSSVNHFVNYLETIRSAGDDPQTAEFEPDLNAVNVMTVHGSKGLEFSVVFMVNLVSDRFPTRSRQDAIEVPKNLIKESLPKGDWHLEEERRLFYVGITRAKKLLYFSWSQDAGGARLKKPSLFLQEAQNTSLKPERNIVLSPIEKIEKFAPIEKPNTQTVLFDVDVLKLTQGSIDDYLTCAYKYRYVHILKIPILRHHAIAYGAALHAAIASFLKSKKSDIVMSLPELLEVFERVWDSEGFLTQEHEEKRKTQGKLALKKFWERESKDKNKPGLIETKFNFSLEGVTIVGRFDRVDIKEGSKIEIIDYKSSENIDEEKANSQAKESTQLAIYALYYWKRHQIMPEKVALHFLETGITGSYKPTVKDLEKTEKLILETSKKIREDTKTNNFNAKPKYFGREPACTYCAYNSICPFSLSKIK